MKNQGYETLVGAGAPEKGRQEIPNEIANEVQEKLIYLMIPDLIRPYLLNPEEDIERDDPILIELSNLWAMKYILGFNGFTEYCNSKSSDRKFIERAKSGNLTMNDYNEMIIFFQEHEQGGMFFENDAEAKDFIDSYKH